MKNSLKRSISLFMGVCLLLSMVALPGVTVAKAVTTVPAGTNLISNGTFEIASEDVLGWSGYNGGGLPLYYSAEQKNSGNYSGAFNDNLASAAHGMAQTITVPVSETDTTYTFSAWVYTETEMQCDIACKPGDTNYKRSSEDTGWRKVEHTGVVVPAGVTSFNIYIFNHKSSADGIVYVDDVYFGNESTGNLVTNPGFEKRGASANSEGWGNASHYTVVENAIADVEKVGSYSMKVVTVNGASLAPYWMGSVNGGKSYSFSVTYKSDFTARTPEVIIYYKNADGSVLETITKALSGAAATWTDYEVTTLAPAGAAEVQINLNFKKAAVGTAYFDNISFVEKTEKFVLNGALVNLGNDLDMKFFIKPTDLTEGETYTAKMVRTYADGSTDTQEETVSKVYSDGDYYVSYKGLAAKEMGDKIAVTIYDSEGNAVSQTWNDSIKDYVGRAMVTYAGNADTVAMLEDMLNYGAAAQIAFGYDANNLVNADLNKAVAEIAGTDVSADNDRAYWNGAELRLESAITFKAFFKSDKVTRDMTAEVSFTNYKNAPVSYTVAGTAFGQDTNDTDLYVPVTGLVIGDTDTVITIVIKDAEGNEVVTVTDSIASYVVRYNSLANADADFVALNKAIMALGASVEAAL